jgi:hypothetical protein
LSVVVFLEKKKKRRRGRGEKRGKGVIEILKGRKEPQQPKSNEVEDKEGRKGANGNSPRGQWKHTETK